MFVFKRRKDEFHAMRWLKGQLLWSPLFVYCLLSCQLFYFLIFNFRLTEYVANSPNIHRLQFQHVLMNGPLLLYDHVPRVTLISHLKFLFFLFFSVNT